MDNQTTRSGLMWRIEDPRHFINKRRRIIIVKPPGIISFGYVDTKEGWDIFTNFEGYKNISAHDKWDITWQWIDAPITT